LGRIRIVQDGVLLDTPFLDISSQVITNCSECGLLGLAFPPDFAQEGYFFVNYTSNTDLAPPETGDPDPEDMGDTVIARFHVTDDPNIAGDEEQILAINQPDRNHNGGHILFGPDGNLYIGMGDGGGGGDTYRNGQDPASLLGKVLRISVGETMTYTIPASNPFTNTEGYRDEIWALGVRNPWRFNFDRATGDFYLADVGQGTYEEVNHVAAAQIGNGGMNFGWRTMEGNVCFPPTGSQNCNRTGLTLPVVTYDHSHGNCSVTGGFVFHSTVPNQAPVYLYADYCSGRLWGLQRDGEEWVSQELEDFPFQVTTFGEDEDGTIYIVDYDGVIYRIVDRLAAMKVSKEPSRILANLGDTIGYSYTITNTGSVTLTGLIATDDLLGDLQLSHDELAPNEVATATLSMTATHTGELTNTVYVTATGDGLSVTASAQVAVRVVNAGFVMTKTVGIADITPECTGLTEDRVPVSTTVIYCYTITNTGDEPLTNHSLQDSHLGQVPLNSAFVLQPGQSFTTTVTETLTVSVTNVATWTAEVSQVAIAAPIDEVVVAASGAATVTISSDADDEDSDGIPDNVEGAGDGENDNLPNFADMDSDGDGLSDQSEAGPDPLNPVDSDGDGTPDFLEADDPTALDPDDQPQQEQHLLLPAIRSD
jgi:uncharacterized repeat protein (TIGR01451 family)